MPWNLKTTTFQKIWNEATTLFLISLTLRLKKKEEKNKTEKKKMKKKLAITTATEIVKQINKKVSARPSR